MSVSDQTGGGPYFNVGSTIAGATASLPPDYPTRRTPARSAKLFVQVGTYPTRNFATLGPL